MNAIILHGTGSSSKDYWFPYLKTELEKLGYNVWVPDLPNSNDPNKEEWIPYILHNGVFEENTVLIGHSAGAQAALNVLQDISRKIKGVILVSGFAKLLKKSSKNKDYEEPCWEVIREHAEKFVIINSDNDPWGWDDKQGTIMHDHLGGQLIIRNNGHMGSTTYNQPYTEFPLLVDLVKKI